MTPDEELKCEWERDDDIVDAMQEALSNNDGQCSAKYLRYFLAKCGLEIVEKEVA